MTLSEFQNQMQRLIEQFGKSAYSQARTELVWREVKELNPRWWECTVDRLLGECRQPPLMHEFREDISKERERLWTIEKRKNEESAKQFFNGTYMAPEIKEICQTIRDRLADKISDENYSSFVNLLNYTADQTEMKGAPNGKEEKTKS